MKRLHLAIGLCITLTTPVVHATPVFHPAGSNLVYGSVSNGYSVLSSVNNPAAAATQYKPGETETSFGILSSVGVGFEIGSVDNIYDEIDAKSQQFESTVGSFASISSTSGVNAVVTELNTTVTDVNNLLSMIEDNGYAKGSFSLQWPLSPIQVSTDWLGGSLVFAANSSLLARIGVVQDKINIDTSTLQNSINNAISSPGSTQTNGDLSIVFNSTTGNVNFNATNDSTAILKAAYVTELSLGYGRKVWNNSDGNLFTGVRGTYYRVELLRDYERFASNTDSQDLFNNITDQDRTTNTGIGLDVGTLWVTSNYHLGATLTNINEPSFDYNPISLSAYTDTATIGKLDATETYTMERQLKVEGAVYTDNKHWIIGAALDANAVKDPTGDEYQWAVVSAAYLSDHWWLPAVRVGYRTNQAGSKLGYLTGGITIFKGLNIDVAYSTSKVEIDNSSITRGLIANIGLEVTF